MNLSAKTDPGTRLSAQSASRTQNGDRDRGPRGEQCAVLVAQEEPAEGNQTEAPAKKIDPGTEADSD
jgi:hypothetical protein